MLHLGADVNLQNSMGHTPLHLAVLHGHTSVLKKLVKKNPRTDLKSNDGETALDIINEYDDRKIYEKYLPKTHQYSDTNEVFSILKSPEPEEDSVSDEETFSSSKKEDPPKLQTPEKSTDDDKKSEKKTEKSDEKTKKSEKKTEKKKKSDSDSENNNSSEDSGTPLEELLNSEEELELDEKVLAYMKNFSKKKNLT